MTCSAGHGPSQGMVPFWSGSAICGPCADTSAKNNKSNAFWMASRSLGETAACYRFQSSPRGRALLMSWSGMEHRSIVGRVKSCRGFLHVFCGCRGEAAGRPVKGEECYAH